MDTQINVINEEAKPQDPDEIWEDRHRKITDAITKYLRDEERLPSGAEMVEETGLSRLVIQQHLDKFSGHQLYKDSIEQFRLLQGKVLMKLASMALKGDLGATKLYFKTVKKMGLEPDPQLLSLFPNFGLPAARVQQDEPAEEKRQQWEDNHHKIVESTTKLMAEKKRMPSQGELAEATGISRQDIGEHLRNFTGQPGYKAEMEQFRGIAGELLNHLSTKAMDGDVPAANVFLYVVTNIYPKLSGMAALAGQPGFGFMMAA